MTSKLFFEIRLAADYEPTSCLHVDENDDDDDDDDNDDLLDIDDGYNETKYDIGEQLEILLLAHVENLERSQKTGNPKDFQFF